MLFRSANPQLHDLLFDNLSLNYSIIDLNGNYVHRNDANQQNISQALANAEEIDPITWADCKKVMQDKKRAIKEEKFKGRIFLSIKQPIIKNNQSVGIIVLSVDITEQKQAEIAKNEFLMNMQHDLRTPFSGLISLSTMLFEQETDPIKKEFQGMVSQSAGRLLQLLDQILEISKLGDHPLCYDKFNIKSLVNEVFELLKAEIYTKRIVLSINCPDSFVETDKMRFSRILLNLLGNAIKFTAQGKITLTISLKSNLYLSISDTGIGIPKDKLNIIFDKFAKVKLSNTDADFKGSGIGLYVVKQFVDELGGAIQVKSKLGKGSTFAVSLPLIKLKVA